MWNITGADVTSSMHVFSVVGVDRCIDLDIPAFINKAKAEITASVSLASASASENPPIYRKEVSVVSDDYFLIFIQTDKPLYRPGQTGESGMNE